MRAMTSSASRSCGTAFGWTNEVTSIRGRPAADSKFTTSTFCSVGMKSGSIWNPSRVPTSQIVTRSGSRMASPPRSKWSKLYHGRRDPRGDRHTVVDILNTLLSDEYLLYTKTRNYHWNVTGPQFNDLHKFFEAQYEELNEFVDDVAERARQLGGRAFGSLAEFVKTARLNEAPGAVPAARDMIASLLADHEAIIRSLRADIGPVVDKYNDVGTSDFLTGLLEKHEKMAWMLRAFLA